MNVNSMRTKYLGEDGVASGVDRFSREDEEGRTTCELNVSCLAGPLPGVAKRLTARCWC